MCGARAGGGGLIPRVMVLRGPGSSLCRGSMAGEHAGLMCYEESRREAASQEQVSRVMARRVFRVIRLGSGFSPQPPPPLPPRLRSREL